MTKTLTIAFLAGAAVVASYAFALTSASAFDVVAKKTLQEAPKGYHLDGFTGWDHGYPVVFGKCTAGHIVTGACAPIMPLKQPV